ncbi:MAG TPA: hypothetical protein VGW40_06600 [Allosphingosinicella sp.]|nr:hypothetical protein [Allosphingosinicella sp.]
MAGAGLRWPVVNPGNSWSAPRIAMPGFFAVQWDFGLESWFYGGHAIDEGGNLYSLNVYFARAALDPADPANRLLQGVMLGAGIGVAADDSYHVCIGQGIGAFEDPAIPVGLVVPPVADQAYSVAFAPEGAGPAGSVRFVPATEPVGPAVGMAGARYRLDVEGVDSAGAPLTLGLDLIDALGTRMEGCSAYVGPPIDPTGLYTYEVAQPRLAIAGGTLTVAGKTVTLAGGSLWHDRQVYNQDPSAPPAPGKGLYCGTWMPLLFDSGMTATISANWKVGDGQGTQWMSGRALHRPPIGGTGNLYAADDPDLLNGGALLRAIRENSSEPWDFDINIFDPDDAENSPHWSAGGAGDPTYCTKWWVTFSDRLVSGWGLPRDIYILALVQGCEFAPQGEKPFWEGATEIFADRACTRRIGRGWAEQMGYN